MNYLMLLMIIVFCAAQSPVTKFYNQKTGNKSAYIYGAMTSFIAMLFFACSSGKFEFNPAFLGYSVGFGAAYATATVCNVMALACGSLALTALVVSFSLMIPTLYGIWFLEEPTSVWLYLGIITLLISLFLIHFKKEEGQITLKWIVLVILAFIGNGMCSTVQKMQQIAFDGAYKGEFMVVALALVSLTMLIFAMMHNKQDIAGCVKKGWYFAVLYGILNGTVNLLVMVLGNRMSASLMFPMISAGGIVINFFLSKYYFKEDLSRMQMLGLLVGIVSIVFFNL